MKPQLSAVLKDIEEQITSLLDARITLLRMAGVTPDFVPVVLSKTKVPEAKPKRKVNPRRRRHRLKCQAPKCGNGFLSAQITTKFCRNIECKRQRSNDYWQTHHSKGSVKAQKALLRGLRGPDGHAETSSQLPLPLKKGKKARDKGTVLVKGAR